MSSGNSSPAADAPAVSVLVVEDHVDTLEALTRLLRASRFDVRSATSCASARLAAGIDAGPPDVVVGDIGLPDGNGADLLAELKARYGCRTIALSGWDESKANDGVDRHMVKPVDLGALRDAIHQEASEPRNQ